MKREIAVLPGDGIGPEVMAAAVQVLKEIEKRFSHRFTLVEAKIGGAAYDHHQTHFPEETRNICQGSDAILFGSVGGPVTEASLPKWRGCEVNSILALRKTFQFAVNYRPVAVYPELLDSSPLKPQLLERGIDLVVIRELVGDLYFGEHRTEVENGRRKALDVAEYDEDQIALAAKHAFELAKTRRRRVTSVDKANVLDTSKLWRTVVSEVAHSYPEVQLEHMLVDNCAMQLITAPDQFDVIVTSNMFGDILSDAAAVLPGSLGLLASASLNEEGFGLYEPPGGSAPDIAGKNLANPVGQILAAAFLLRVSFGLIEEAQAIETAVKQAIRDGFRTRDLAREGWVTTEQMTDAILSRL
jgi:3-isopropylmalate dehydrogenase